MNLRWTAVAVVLLVLGAACRAPRPPAPEPAQEQTDSGLGDTGLMYQVSAVCVVLNGRMTVVDTYSGVVPTIEGRSWSEAFPDSAKAASAPWYVNNEPIVFGGHRYVRYGLIRSFGTEQLVTAGRYRGVPVFAEPNAGVPPEVIYVPESEFCFFQPYQRAEAGAAVRG